MVFCLIRELWNHQGKRMNHYERFSINCEQLWKSIPALPDAFQKALQRMQERLRLNIPDSYAFPSTTLA